MSNKKTWSLDSEVKVQASKKGQSKKRVTTLCICASAPDTTINTRLLAIMSKSLLWMSTRNIKDTVRRIRKILDKSWPSKRLKLSLAEDLYHSSHLRSLVLVPLINWVRLQVPPQPLSSQLLCNNNNKEHNKTSHSKAIITVPPLQAKVNKWDLGWLPRPTVLEISKTPPHSSQAFTREIL